MSKGYKCDITGKLHEGDPLKDFAVDTYSGRLLIIPQVRSGKSRYLQGGVSPEGAAQVQELLGSLASKTAVAKKVK